MKRLFSILLCLAMLSSCGISQTIMKKDSPSPVVSAPPNPVPAVPPSPVEDFGTKAAGNIDRPLVSPSRPKSVDVPTVLPQEPKKEAQTRQGKAGETTSEKPYQIQVENMPLGEFVNLVFGKVLETSYSVDKSVEGRKETVTLNMKAPAQKGEVLEIVREILRSYGLGIEKKENVTFVGPVAGQPQKPIIPYYFGNVPGNIPSSEVVGLITQVYYVRPQDLIGVASGLALSAQGKVQVVPGSSMLSVIDDAGHARAAGELITALDRPSLTNKKVKLFYLNYLPTGTFRDYLAQALPAQGIPVGKGHSDHGLLLIPIGQIKAVLAVSPKQEWLTVIGFWQEKLDVPSIGADEPQFFIYRPKNRRASDLAKVFGATSKGTREKSQKLGARTSGASDTFDQQAQAQGLPQAQVQTQQLPRAGLEREAEAKPAKATLSLADVAVVVDDDSNSLIFTATSYQYSRVLEILEKLDQLPKQVLVEVTIGEVTLSGTFQFGIEWAVTHHTGNLTGELGTLGSLGIGSSGFVYTVAQLGDNFQATLNAFAKDGLLKVLSTPRLVVLDNQEASINVGTDVPIVTSESSAAGLSASGTTSLLRSIQYRKTGVILNIKPTINSAGMLTLTLKQEVSDATANTISPDISSPLVTTRNVETSVALKSGSSVLLGGLIKNNSNDTVSKVPFVGDVPLLRSLFRTMSKTTDRTELFIQITPHILSSPEEAESATRNYKDLFKMLGN